MSGPGATASIVLPVGPEAAFEVGAVSITPDGVHGTMPTGRPFVGPDGRPSVGALGVLVDDVTGYAVIDGLIDGAWSVSAEIWVDLLRPIPPTGSLSARARVAQSSTVSAFTEGWVRDDAGITVAQCRQRGRAIPENPFDLDPPNYRVRTDATDVADLIGLQPIDGLSALLTVTADLENPRHMLHGGVSFCASEVTALQSRRAAGVDLPTSSVHIAHTRGIPAGSEVLFRAETRHAGRTFWITEVTGWVNGKVACVSTVSAQAL